MCVCALRGIFARWRWWFVRPCADPGSCIESVEEVVEIVAQASDGGWISVIEAVGEATCGGARGRRVGGIHDGVEGALDNCLVGLGTLLRIAALDEDGEEGCRQGSRQA